MSDELYYKRAAELSRLLERREISSVELTQAVIDRTEQVESRIGAFLHFDPGNALAQARESDRYRERGEERGPLEGIPIGIKDLISVKDQRLTCGSKILENFISPYDASAVAKLREAGAVLWGRLNLDEFAMGSSTENSAFHPTRNPWDLGRIPGGSSGGSAAAVAAGETILALGTDTGGSIRQPASHCGVVGLKPTYGLVSRYGLVAFASSLDQIGPIGRSVEDVALLLQGIAAHDPLDSTSVSVEIPDYREALHEERDTWRIGLPSEYFSEGLDAEVRRSVEGAISFYAASGAEIVELALPHTDLAIPVYYIIATAEASSNLARYDGVRYTRRSEGARDHVDLYFKTRGEGFGEEVKRRIILGTYALSSGYYDAYYLRAQKVRTLIRDDFLKAFEDVDFIITPVSPTTAFRIGERTSDPLEMYLSDIYTISLNLAGLPGISIPCGFDKKGLPIGLQIVGRHYGESDLLRVAHQFEASHSYRDRHPATAPNPHV